MRVGGGKAKGASYEREVCTKLSLWVSKGKQRDLFWRSAMSGGRATVAADKLRHQAGDISAVAPKGHSLTDRFYVECKFLRDLKVPSFFLRGSGKLASFWLTACQEAAGYDRTPLLIAKQNNWPALVIMPVGALRRLSTKLELDLVTVTNSQFSCDVYQFDDLLAQPYRAKDRK